MTAWAGEAPWEAEEAVPRESEWSLRAEADFNSRYVWRGLAFSPGAVLQPAIEGSYGPVTLAAWCNLDLEPPDGTPAWNETDLTLSYQWESGPWRLVPEVRSYLYPAAVDQPDTVELALNLGWNLGSGFAAVVQPAVDAGAYAGACYTELGVRWEHVIDRRLTLEIYPSFGLATDAFTEAYGGVTAGGAHSVGCELSLECKLGKYLTVRPHAGVSRLLDSRWLGTTQPDQVWGGLALSFAYP